VPSFPCITHQPLTINRLLHTRAGRIFTVHMNQHETQLQIARAGVVSPAMSEVARAERLDPETVRDRVARGRIIIPANHHHTRLTPIGIGDGLRTKINANIGNSPVAGDVHGELTKLDVAVRYGADTVMDLSTGDDADRIRQAIIHNSAVPIGTVPIYAACAQVDAPESLTGDLLLKAVDAQARQGVDYMTVHAGILRDHLAAANMRLLGIVSRGGAILAKWMTDHQTENPFYARFDDLLDICLKYDVTLSLGDGLRPGCLADASDDAQFAELKVLGELVERCRAAGVQVMVEGPGHIPLDQIRMNMEREAVECDGAPFYVLGPVVTDCAPGYDHITSAIGAAVGAFHGAAMLCYVTPKEHLGLPNARDVRDGVVAYKIAAHAADIARGIPGARDRDDAISRARAEFKWEEQFALALDPEKARELRNETLAERAADTVDATDLPVCDKDDEYCTMCGPKFCSMRISRELKKADTGAAAK